ncbi:P-loop ATPase, Sll1717 family [Clostridium celatum]|uniref:P-loop ATPase, Sll1717 family n=1 Tax=Clostridium celatum TaxID=36834 RepID=UPI0029048BBB|nr:hypothetical protein [Clostridium celatum]MDU2169479.1 hypothetical protein [Clostridium perfringens]MDU6297458.1 hypothetical protein [Clostridium celatum]
MTVYLKDLYFGYADGDTESSKDNFKDLFYTGNNKYNDITTGDMKFIISGQKGTGKTILGRYIEETYKERCIECKIFNKNDITLVKLIEKKNDILSNDEAVHFFKWIIYYEIFKMLKNIKIMSRFRFKKEWIKEFRYNRKYRDTISKLEKLYEERYPKGNFEFIEYMTSNEDIIEAELASDTVIKGKAAGTNKQTKSINNKRKEFYKVLEEVEHLILQALKYKSVVIILDDLDELEIKIDNNKAPLASIKKLIEAFKDINTLFVKEQVSPSKCIMLIRSDILNKLNKTSTNLNKVLVDNTVELYWINKDEKYPEKHILMEMILNKIKTTSDEYKGLDNKTLYKKLFPDYIDGDSALKFLLDHSFGRPRDIICFLGIITERYPDETEFKDYMFKECRQEYSERFLNELYNEMNIHIKIEIIEDYLKLIRMLGYKSFYEKKIKRFYRENKHEFRYIKDINKALETLYEFGIIGNSWKINEGTPNEKMKFSWGYRKDGNPHINVKQRFSIHYGLRNALNVN